MSTLKTTNIAHPSSASNNIVLDSSGRMLVGTSSATALGTAFIQGNSAGATNAGYLSLQRGQAAGASITGGTLLGVIQFGDSSANSFAQIYAEGDGASGTNDYPGRLAFSVTADGASTPTERMRISSSGRFSMGGGAAGTNGNLDIIPNYTTGTGNFTHTACLLQWTTASSSNARTACLFENAGATVGSIHYTNAAVTYSTTSDYRLKENVASVSDGIARLQQLKPCRFNFVVNPGQFVDGFLAHEVQTVVPEAISGEKDAVDADGKPVYQGIDQSKLVPLLTAALQEAITRIEQLEARITTLEAN